VTKKIDPHSAKTFRRLWQFVLPYKMVGVIALFGMAGTALVEGSLVYLLEPLTDEALVAQNLETTRWIPLAFIGIFVLRGIFGIATEYSLGWIGRNVISALRRTVFCKFLTLPTRFFEERTAGPLLSRITYNVEMIAESVTTVVTVAIRDVLTVIAAITVMYLQSPTLLLFVAIVIPIVAMVVRVLGRAFRRYSGRIQDSVGEVMQVTEEIVRGNRIVKIFGGYEYESERLDEVDRRNKKQNLKLIRVRSFGVATTQIIFGFGVAGVIYMAGRESLEGNLSPGQFISFFSAMMLTLQPVRRITNVNAVIQRGVAAGQSLFEVIDEADEIDTGSIVLEKVRGRVEYRDVSFAYGENNSSVLESVSVTVEPGASLAIVGHSGGGKSTMVSLLPRFYDVDRGMILLDGTPVRDLTLKNLREHISLVSQDVVLFNDTIANNLRYGQLRKHTPDRGAVAPLTPLPSPEARC
jgi:subfamily B ATP-binding cassette protein MsbA